jgi:hypothetical protein
VPTSTTAKWNGDIARPRCCARAARHAVMALPNRSCRVLDLYVGEQTTVPISSGPRSGSAPIPMAQSPRCPTEAHEFGTNLARDDADPGASSRPFGLYARPPGLSPGCRGIPLCALLLRAR